jgi:hypothetical protein
MSVSKKRNRAELPAASPLEKENKEIMLIERPVRSSFENAMLMRIMESYTSGDSSLKEMIRPESLFSSSSPSHEAKLLANIVNSRKFFEIPRKLRADLCSVDGALLINTTGTILTAGAIVRTDGNLATGGGRSAAARTLARKGFGIKISSDGYIEIYDGENPPVYFA